MDTVFPGGVFADASDKRADRISGNVLIALDGVSHKAAISRKGQFAAIFKVSTLAAGTYPVTYNHGKGANAVSAAGMLTVTD